METALTLDLLVQKYLAWCKKHRSPRSLEWSEGHLKGFLAHLGEDKAMPATSLKPYHVVEWVDSHERWGDTYKGGAIVAVKRLFNWGEELGHVDSNPIKKLKKPQARRRENPMSLEHYQAMLSHLPEGDPFRDVLVFVWHSGARPQEVRHIEPRHVDLAAGCITFPKQESKGKRRARVIILHGPALEIISRLMEGRTEGKLFRNSRGTPWSKYAFCNRAERLSEKIGKSYALYDLRHAFCQRLLEAGVSLPAVSELMGHANAMMVSSVYSHMNKATAHLKESLRKADPGSTD